MPNASDISLRKLPPHDDAAELYVLGACLHGIDPFAKALEAIQLEDFYKVRHQNIFTAMEALFEKGDAIDVLTVADQLRKMGKFDDVGGIEFLSTLEEQVPTPYAVTHHAKIIREKKILRDLIHAGTEMIEESYDGGADADMVLDQSEKLVFSIAEKRFKRLFYKMSDIVKSSFSQIEKMFDKPGMVTGLETGFTELDEITAGFQPSDLIIIAGRPSMGKTSFALDIARFAACKRQIPTAIFSLEMSKEQLAMRMICSDARVSSVKLRTGFLASADWPNITAAAGRLSEAPIFIDDSAQLSSLDIRARARRLMAEHSVGLIIVDYLQLMSSRSKTESRQLEISEISRGLKNLAKELNVPVVALSQLSRALETRQDKKPLLSDLRESGSIEQDADVVAFIYRDEVYNENSEDVGKADILIRKQRNGPIGDIKLAFSKEYTRFDNLARHESEIPNDVDQFV